MLRMSYIRLCACDSVFALPSLAVINFINIFFLEFRAASQISSRRLSIQSCDKRHKCSVNNNQLLIDYLFILIGVVNKYFSDYKNQMQ